MRVAIDVGASATKVALIGEDGSPRLVRTRGAGEFPSAVFVGPRGGVQVGTRALAYGARDPSRPTTSPKRIVDTPSAVLPVDRTVVLGGTAHRVVDLMAALISHALDTATTPADDRSRLDLVLTHPVGWGEAERAVLTEAARLTGVDTVPTFVTAPEAVAAYVLAEGLAVLGDGAVAVFDLGASTFDVAVVTGDGDESRTLTSAGRLLGGQDIDTAFDPDDLTHAMEQVVTSCLAAFEQCLATVPRTDPVGTVVGSGASLRIPVLREQLATLARERGAKAVFPDDDVGLGQVAALGALHAATPVVAPLGTVPVEELTFPVAASAVLPVPGGHFACGDPATRLVEVWTMGGPDEGARLPTGGGLAQVRCVETGPVTGHILTGTDHGCVEIWDHDGSRWRLDGTLAPTASPGSMQGSMQGENVTGAAIDFPYAAYVKQGRTGAIHEYGSPGRRRCGSLPAGRPEFLSFLWPHRLVVVDMPEIRLVDVDGTVRARTGYPGRYCRFVGAAVSRSHGLLAVSTAESLVVWEVGRAGFDERLRLAGGYGPVGLIHVDGDVLLACSPDREQVFIAGLDGDVLGTVDVEPPVDRLRTDGLGPTLGVASGSRLVLLELRRG